MLPSFSKHLRRKFVRLRTPLGVDYPSSRIYYENKTEKNQINSSLQWFMWRPDTKRVRKEKSKEGSSIESQGLE